MAIKGTDLVRMTDDDLLKLCSPARCKVCHDDLHESTTGIRGNKCSDCYFKELGEEVELYPIGIPRLHKGRC
jgi:hypothetical protein